MTDPRYRRQTQQLSTISLLSASIAGPLRQAYEAIELTLPDGYPRGGGEPVSGGDTSNPTLSAVVHREGILDSVEDREADEARRVGLAAIDASLTVAVHALREAHAAATQLGARLTAGHATERTNMTECQACERTVANTPSDRIKSGYCRACYEAWRRADRPDRTQFAKSRRGLDTAPEPEVRTSGVEVVDLTVNGATVRLPADLAVEFHQLEQPTSEDIARLHAAAVDRCHEDA